MPRTASARRGLWGCETTGATRPGPLHTPASELPGKYLCGPPSADSAPVQAVPILVLSTQWTCSGLVCLQMSCGGAVARPRFHITHQLTLFFFFRKTRPTKNSLLCGVEQRCRAGEEEMGALAGGREAQTTIPTLQGGGEEGTLHEGQGQRRPPGLLRQGRGSQRGPDGRENSEFGVPARATLSFGLLAHRPGSGRLHWACLPGSMCRRCERRLPWPRPQSWQCPAEVQQLPQLEGAAVSRICPVDALGESGTPWLSG